MTYKSHTALLDFLVSAMNPGSALPVLDLACGNGRSGLVLARQGIQVIFADKSERALNDIEQHLSNSSLTGSIWQVDLEQAGTNPFDKRVFSAVICFRYLHRPLFPYLLESVEPGGLIIYETFTTGNLIFGRPRNPDFLLGTGELKSLFSDWEIVHYYQGVQHRPERSIAQIIARKNAS